MANFEMVTASANNVESLEAEYREACEAVNEAWAAYMAANRTYEADPTVANWDARQLALAAWTTAENHANAVQLRLNQARAA